MKLMITGDSGEPIAIVELVAEAEVGGRQDITSGYPRNVDLGGSWPP
jgi:hypothetical protein